MTNSIYKQIDMLFDFAREVKPVKSSRIVAGMFDGKALISLRNNSMKSDPFQKKYGTTEHNIYIHAEIGAIKAALKAQKDTEYLEQLTLIVVRAKKIKGVWQYGDSKPCLGCRSAITEFNIGEIVYYENDKWISTKEFE